MVGTYDYWLVLLSVVVAITASYVALDLASRVAASQGRKSRAYWLAGGAVSMGTGIWSMHFIGMLAFHLPIPVSYDIPITLLSLLIAIAAAGFALFWVSFGPLGMGRLLSGGLFMGAAIIFMHYTGMGAMRMDPPIQYQPFVFGLSALVALAASVVALWSAFRLRLETITTAFWKKAGSTLVMGTAIYGMHYAGMAAAIFAPNSVCTVSPQNIDNIGLAGSLGGFTLLFLTATLLVSAFDADLAERSSEHAKALREAHDLLEARVVERTTELARTNQSLLEQIAERKAAEERIRESEARLRTFMNNSPSAMFIKDLQGRYLHVNEQFTRSFGLDRRNVLLRTAAEIFPPDLAAKLEATDARVLAAGAPIETEETVSLKDGAHTHIVCKFPISDVSGQITALGGIRTDITERERAEREIRASREQLRALASRIQTIREEGRTLIARNVHDELGQALTAAKIDLSLLEQDLKSRKRQLSPRRILREVRSARRTIDKAIDSIGSIATQLRPIVLDQLGLAAAIDWQVQDFEKRTRLKCKMVSSRDLPEPDKELSIVLFRILQEALTNVVRHAAAKAVEVEFKEEGGNCVLQVRDDGIGISDSQRNGPSSLGLVGMRERALMFGGQVVIERGPRGGTIVTASIPRKAEPAAAA